MKISVCLATYNGASFIIRQLDSVLNQLNEDDQVIIVDDRSKDNTVELIKQKYGNKVEVFINKENLGAIKSFEKALGFADGDVIFLCDQDDIWEEDKVSKVVNAFQNEHADLVVHDALVVDGDLHTMNKSWNAYNSNNILQGLLGNILKNAFTGAMMAFKKELVPLFLPLPKDIEMHDQWIAIVAMLEKKKIVYIDEPLMKYVRHGGNVTGMRKRSYTEKLSGRIGTVKAVLQYKKSKS
ncbi:glycosyltransferase family 2 protein [Bacillus sp. DNRA2]|uniref:glycosyltransferase family 2 protein n=1 Tax=Bacillus sp. DNRA2 TaxID=2723053 RepID=UPI00145F1DBD|nr:glycosyltransferase family 2 protein [Bacillus sp. DNRA2]NMD68813.1 glycosyltransferase family 2 protein [Bacillus sp. DNRA2]